VNDDYVYKKKGEKEEGGGEKRLRLSDLPNVTGAQKGVNLLVASS